MYWLKNFAALIITLAVVLIAGLIFILNLSSVSVQDEFVSLSSPALNGEVEIYRDQYGIVHLKANKESDAYFGMGYIHAQDRLWQMDYQRRLSYGRLSELFSEKTFEVDQMMRIIDIDRISSTILEKMDNKTLAILESYCAGINFFIDKNANKLQFEFGALSYTPDKWTPKDCIALLRLDALMKSRGFWTDLSIGVIAEKIGINNTMELLPEIDKFSPTVYSDKVWKDVDKTFLRKIEEDTSSVLAMHNAKIMQNVIDAHAELKDFLNLNASSIGTNSWVRVKSLDIAVGAVVAVDPHDPIQLPGKWYPLHITYPKANITGLTLPGIPIFYHGRNDNIA
jgi:penicillin G amidase